MNIIFWNLKINICLVYLQADKLKIMRFSCTNNTNIWKFEIPKHTGPLFIKKHLEEGEGEWFCDLFQPLNNRNVLQGEGGSQMIRTLRNIRIHHIPEIYSFNLSLINPLS